MEVSHLIGGIKNHFGLLDERETKDGINSDFGSGCNPEGGRSALPSEIWHVKLETDSEFSCNQCITLLNNTAEGDGNIIGLAVDGRNRMKEYSHNCSKKKDIAC
jgi:hypothetical protein